MSGQTYTVLPPDRGGRQLGKILEALALMQATGGMPFSALVNAQVQHITRGSTIVLITPSVREQVALTVDLLLRRGLRPIVLLIDSEAFGGPPGTEFIAEMIKAFNVPIRVLNPDTGLEIGLNSPI